MTKAGFRQQQKSSLLSIFNAINAQNVDSTDIPMEENPSITATLVLITDQCTLAMA